MTLRHEFVDHIPDEIDDGVLYVSLRFGTVVHRCVCGCGQEVVTPLGPAEWQLTYDGESISLAPSVANWSLPCQSHYWIKDGSVRWARRRMGDGASRTRQESRNRRDEYFRSRSASATREKGGRDSRLGSIKDTSHGPGLST